jgi:hypothetical protein
MKRVEVAGGNFKRVSSHFFTASENQDAEHPARAWIRHWVRALLL